LHRGSVPPTDGSCHSRGVLGGAPWVDLGLRQSGCAARGPPGGHQHPGHHPGARPLPRPTDPLPLHLSLLLPGSLATRFASQKWHGPRLSLRRLNLPPLRHSLNRPCTRLRQTSGHHWCPRAVDPGLGTGMRFDCRKWQLMDFGQCSQLRVRHLTLPLPSPRHLVLWHHCSAKEGKPYMQHLFSER
jgi:hypothetical protein